MRLLSRIDHAFAALSASPVFGVFTQSPALTTALMLIGEPSTASAWLSTIHRIMALYPLLHRTARYCGSLGTTTEKSGSSARPSRGKAADAAPATRALKPRLLKVRVIKSPAAY